MGLFNPFNKCSVEAVSLPREDSVNSRISPWLAPLAYQLGNRVILPLYFEQIEIIGQENIPLDGPVILAPNHRARWDALLVPHAVGRGVTGRNVRFMVTSDEMKGLQGWLIRHLGGFPVNPRHPAIASLRFGIELLRQGEMLVIFPEGGIFRDKPVQALKQGLARLALQAENLQPGLGIRVVPIYIEYDEPYPQWSSKAILRIGKPLLVADYNKASAKVGARRLTADLLAAMQCLEQQRVDQPEISEEHSGMGMPEHALITAYTQDNPV